MKLPGILFGLFIISSTVSAQSFLTDYYNGTMDSLIVGATQLIHSPDPTFHSDGNPIQPAPQELVEMGSEGVYNVENHYFTARDNKLIFAYYFPNPSPDTIVLLHGVASSAYLYNKTAVLLRVATGAEVYAIDLRGHGRSEGDIGDVSYINQYVDDLADIIGTIRNEKPDGKIIIAGHSMGGGIALRYAMEEKLEQPDGFLLFAPLIGHNMPAISPIRTDDHIDNEPFMKIHFERIIGLKMLNEVGNHEYDYLPVLFFNFPETVPLRKYSYRANASMAPDDYEAGLKALEKPTLVLIGSDDEVFSAEWIRKVVVEYSKAEVHIIEGASHNGVRHSENSFTLINKWFLKL
jgi:alpha-beta hydrolase superfamily lysophospholipase